MANPENAEPGSPGVVPCEPGQYMSNGLRPAVRGAASGVAAHRANAAECGTCAITLNQLSDLFRQHVPRRLVRLFERHGDVEVFDQNQRHVGDRPAGGERLDVGSRSTAGLIRNGGQAFVGRLLELTCGHVLPAGAVDAVRVVPAGRERIDDQDMNAGTEECGQVVGKQPTVSPRSAFCCWRTLNDRSHRFDVLGDRHPIPVCRRHHLLHSGEPGRGEPTRVESINQGGDPHEAKCTVGGGWNRGPVVHRHGVPSVTGL